MTKQQNDSDSLKQQDELNQIKSKIQDHLIASGEYELINKQLKLQLYESGWYDKVAQITNNHLNSSGNQEEVKNISDLYAFVRPKAEEIVPQDIRDNMMKKIEQYLDGIID
ncbi:SUS1 [Candida pseudojiufengensis]|uniref:SUS1 n=1 Tax=Candida pseudojiufengensis TaxID=497109 RepID=UPI002225A5EB|nr:SUS1 [Candida pseudojiufengensis]KAI5961619.1 SUS1 [Candida pseudojiufengensis]